MLIRRVRRGISERARAVHADLQPAAYLLLAHLAYQGPHRASALAEVFDIDKGAVSRQVQHLLDLGLVDRQPDPDDGRATLLTPSKEGRRGLDTVTRSRRMRLEEQLGDWPEDDLARFTELLGRYNRALG